MIEINKHFVIWQLQHLSFNKDNIVSHYAD